MISKIQNLIKDGAIASVYLNVEEAGMLLERYTFDIELNFSRKIADDAIDEIARSGFDTVLKEFIGGKNGRKEFELFYGAVTHHLIRVIQV